MKKPHAKKPQYQAPHKSSHKSFAPPRSQPYQKSAPATGSRTTGTLAPKETHWAEVADWYDKLVGDDGSEYHQHVVIPGVFRMLDLETKKPRVLDLACGQGVLSRKLAEAGCTVLGLDAAAPLIEAAQRRNETEKLRITYAVADATKLVDDHNKLLPPLQPESQDAITIILAIQNMTPLSPVWQACKSILKPGGTLVVVMMHPCFRVPRQSDWIWEDRGSGGVGEQGRVIKQYLSSSKVDIQTHPGLAAHGKDDSTTPHFHRPLQAYINTLGNAGLLIDHVEEWISHKISQPGPKKAALDRARKEIPMFLAIRAKKNLKLTAKSIKKQQPNPHHSSSSTQIPQIGF